MIILPYNSKKPNEYNYYHMAVMSNEKVIKTYFDLTFETVINELDKINSEFNYKIIGTLEKVDDCLKYINFCRNDGIIIFIERKDIFEKNDPIFVDCTNYFNNKEIQK